MYQVYSLQDIFIVALLLEGWPTQAKEEPFPHEVRSGVSSS